MEFLVFFSKFGGRGRITHVNIFNTGLLSFNLADKGFRILTRYEMRKLDFCEKLIEKDD